MARIDNPEKNWKFSVGDVKESGHWDNYMHAYQEALNGTSRPWAPWYAIPADNKPFMRNAVAEIIVKTLRQLPLKFPKPTKEQIKQMHDLRSSLAES